MQKSLPSSFFRLSLNLCLILILFAPTACRVKARKAGPGPGDKVYPVSVMRVEWEEVPDVLEFKGNFLPSDKLDVKSEVEGKIVQVNVNEGQSVNAADNLASISPDKLNLLLEKQRLEEKEIQARIEAGLAVKPVIPVTPVSPVARPESLPSEGQSDSPQALNPDEIGDEVQAAAPAMPGALPTFPPGNNLANSEKSEAILRAEEASLDRIRAEISLTEKKIEGATITAGIPGIVSKKNITEGSVISLGEILFQIIKIDPLYLSLYVSHDVLPDFQKLDDVSVYAEDFPDQSFSGDIIATGQEPDGQNKNYEVKISLPNTQLKVKPGMVGRVFLPTGRSHKLLAIPESAVLSKGNENWVYLVKGPVAERQEIELGKKLEGNKVEVKKGISEGATLVTKGNVTFKEEQEFIKIQ